MRLYLSSFRIGDHPDRLADLLARTGDPRPVAVVANAIDGADADRRRSSVADEIAALAGLGIEATELDLREVEPRTADDRLAEFRGLWVRGGNVFVLRHAMRTSGTDAVILRRLASDDLVFAGYSAGPCALAPDLHGLEWCDDADEVDRLYGVAPTWSGLGVLDRPVVPHLETPGHPETAVLGVVADRFRAAGTPFWAMRDGDVLLVDGDPADAVVLPRNVPSG